jgi:hypothetical protein
MLSLDTTFAIANIWILPGWLLLAAAPGWKYTSRIVYYLIIFVLAVSYASLLLGDITQFDPEAGSSLENLTAMFSDPKVALVGWIHYLAFDLLAGLVIAIDGKRVGVHRLLMLIPLFLTLMTGPFGLLIYTLIRFIYVRRAEVPLIG